VAAWLEDQKGPFAVLLKLMST